MGEALLGLRSLAAYLEAFHTMSRTGGISRGGHPVGVVLAGGWGRYRPGAPHQNVGKSSHTEESRVGLEVSGFRIRG